MVSLEFESGRAPLVTAWDNWDFTPSPEPIKYAFQKIKFPQIKKNLIITNPVKMQYRGNR